jgi:hypothetical protein
VTGKLAVTRTGLRTTVAAVAAVTPRLAPPEVLLRRTGCETDVTARELAARSTAVAEAVCAETTGIAACTPYPAEAVAADAALSAADALSIACPVAVAADVTARAALPLEVSVAPAETDAATTSGDAEQKIVFDTEAVATDEMLCAASAIWPVERIHTRPAEPSPPVEVRPNRKPPEPPPPAPGAVAAAGNAPLPVFSEPMPPTYVSPLNVLLPGEPPRPPDTQVMEFAAPPAP